MDRQDRTCAKDREAQVDKEHPDQRWPQRDFSLAAQAATESADADAQPEILTLNHAKASLRRGDDAVKLICADWNSAKDILVAEDFSQLDWKQRMLLIDAREALVDLAGHIQQVKKAHRETKQELDSLKLSVRSLVRFLTLSCHKQY